MNTKLENKYNQINTPEELLIFMSKYINYGYLGKNNKVYHFDDENFDKDWYKEYILETKEDILKTSFGNCFDQTELERNWFEEHNYEYKTIYIQAKLKNNEDIPCHSFLIYKNKKDNGWNWFENSDYNNRGIHNFSNLNDLLEHQLNTYIEFLNSLNIKEIEKIIRKEFQRPKDNCTANEYLDWTTSNGVDI